MPVPKPGPGEVLVKVMLSYCWLNLIERMIYLCQVEAVGICAGDAKTYMGATRFWGNDERGG